MSETNWNWNRNKAETNKQQNAWQYQQSSSSYPHQHPHPQQHPNQIHQPNIPSTDYYAQNMPSFNYNTQQQQQSTFFDSSQPSIGVFDGSMMSNFSNQVMADPMLNAAKQIGGQFAEQQKEKFNKYLSALQLKYYFAVDNSYVGNKLAILLFPFFHKDWSIQYNDSNESAAIPPKYDINAPDLYIPLMAFTTYILLSGFVLGLHGRFTPEQLGIIMTNAMVYLIFENIVIFITKYLMNISQSLSIWHSLAYSGYKYVGMNVNLLAFIVGGKMCYYGALIYTSITIVFFLLRTVKNYVLDVQSTYSTNYEEGRKRKIYLLLFISFTQPFIMWWLTSGVTTSAPSKIDFAQLALSGIGLNKAAGKGQVPVLPDGEIDYESLLKMP